MVSTCRWASRPMPSRYIEIIVTRTTETTIERLRRRPLPISPRRKPRRIRSPAPAELEPGRPRFRGRPDHDELVRVRTAGGAPGRRHRVEVLQGRAGVPPRHHDFAGVVLAADVVADDAALLELDDALAEGVDDMEVVGGH